MSKATDVAVALRNAYETTCELVNVLDIGMADGKINVLVESLRDLEQIPGDLNIHTFDKFELGFTKEAWKQYEGVRFNTFLKEEAKHEDF